jgi:hypothetical protein
MQCRFHSAFLTPRGGVVEGVNTRELCRLNIRLGFFSSVFLFLSHLVVPPPRRHLLLLDFVLHVVALLVFLLWDIERERERRGKVSAGAKR